MIMRATIALVLATLLLGCVSPTPKPHGDPLASTWSRGPDTPRPDYDFTHAIVGNHNHEDRSLHGAHYGLETVGFDPIMSAARPGTLAGGYFELALAGSWAFVSNMGPDRGFSILSIADPVHPRHVSDFVPADFLNVASLGIGSYWDVSVMPDGNLAFLSAQAIGSLPLDPARTDQQAGGIFLVNTRDKQHPTMESFTPMIDQDALIKVGVHNSNPFQIGGVLYLAITTANGKTYIHEVVGTEPHRTLKLVSVLTGMHDTAVQIHPITHKPLLYTATGGVYIWDMSDPVHPQKLSFLPNGPQLQSYHETIPSDVRIDGRHYTVAGGESVEGNPTLFTLLDTTDPESPSIAGTWRLPGDLKGPGAFYTFSGHNFEFDHGRLIIGHYHAGVWIVDASNATNVAHPMPIAFYQPNQAALYVPRTTKGVDNPSVWRATLHDDGYVYTTDTNSGLYVLRPTVPPSPLAGAPTWPTNLR
jgi:hypothetical protein